MDNKCEKEEIALDEKPLFEFEEKPVLCDLKKLTIKRLKVSEFETTNIDEVDVFKSKAELLINQIKEFEQVKTLYKYYKKCIDIILKDLPQGLIFQDDDKIVYKVVKPKGTYVDFKEVDYVRTRKEDEKIGTLSLKEAKEEGFEL